MAQMNGYMDKCDTIEYNGKQYLSREVVLWEGTEDETTRTFAEEQLNEDLKSANFANGGTRIDNAIAGYPPRICLTDLPDRELARYCEEVFYDNEP